MIIDESLYSPLVILLALLLDKLIGEVRYFHPLVGFGNSAYFLEKNLNKKHLPLRQQKLSGILCWLLLVLPLPVAYFCFVEVSNFQIYLDILVLYVAIGLNSLNQHANKIYQPLKNNDIKTARKALAMIVSRDTAELYEQQISRATVESVLENGHDAVIASIFYYLIGGAPLVIAHRLANTLDAMWGYKTERYLYFGWCSARMDDLLGWPSAKLTALCYALVGSKLGLNYQLFSQAFINSYQQAKSYKSLNGGWSMAAGATVLQIKLGGSSIYHGEKIASPILGQGNQVSSTDIQKSLNLVNKATLLLLVLSMAFSLLL